MDYEIEKVIKSNRKTFCIEIDDYGKIILRIPKNSSDLEIEKFLNKHKNWIYKKLKVIEKREIELYPKKFIEGEMFLFLGNFYKLKIVKNQKEKIMLNNNEMNISDKYKTDIRKVIIEFYKKKAFEIISDRVNFYSKKYGYDYNKIKITSANKRFGSCTNKGNLNFTFRLIMAPIEVIDYVVVHELTHLIDKTHKKSFYKKVEKILPDYKKRIKWLNDNSYLLKI
ncbi:MAG TPA: SprT family zinc-dependent metalloprotease [Caldisericia bacterium]|nr:SprT family zinc-dependent metalloprotease [Caldisericia bacterium]HOL82423.1 SprT family zinc-dependent metalloprotease [Caldisericia bacterium]